LAAETGKDASSASGSARKKMPRLDEFLSNRDYVGAMSLLEFNRGSGRGSEELDMWIGYCAFHAGNKYAISTLIILILGDYKRAMLEYEALTHGKKPPRDAYVNLACVFFYLGMYRYVMKSLLININNNHLISEAEKTLEKAEKSRLRNRLRFHLAHKFGDEKKLMSFHQELEDVIEDQLSLASIHYLRSHYQEAIDIYKRILLDNREYLALNVYVALCYYKLDYYDVSQEVLAVYLQHYPDSSIALNLKACNHFRLYNGKAAEQELKTLQDQTSSSFKYALLNSIQMCQFLLDLARI